MRFLILGRSVGLKKKTVKKKLQEKSRNRRPGTIGTPASLPWSLETTRCKPKIDMPETLVDDRRIKTWFCSCCNHAHSSD